MAEQKQMEMLSALMGEEGQDAAKMLLRMQRLQRLLLKMMDMKEILGQGE